MPSFSDNAVHDRIAQFLHHAIRFVSAHPLLSLGKTLAELPEFLEHVRAPLRFFRGPQHAKVVNGNDRCGWDAMLLDYADFFVLADFSEHRSKAVLELTGTDRLFHNTTHALIVRFFGQYITRFALRFW